MPEYCDHEPESIPRVVARGENHGRIWAEHRAAMVLAGYPTVPCCHRKAFNRWLDACLEAAENKGFDEGVSK